jgi:hypothetical protein
MDAGAAAAKACADHRRELLQRRAEIAAWLRAEVGAAGGCRRDRMYLTHCLTAIGRRRSSGCHPKIGASAGKQGLAENRLARELATCSQHQKAAVLAEVIDLSQGALTPEDPLTVAVSVAKPDGGRLEVELALSDTIVALKRKIAAADSSLCEAGEWQLQLFCQGIQEPLPSDSTVGALLCSSGAGQQAAGGEHRGDSKVGCVQEKSSKHRAEVFLLLAAAPVLLNPPESDRYYSSVWDGRHQHSQSCLDSPDSWCSKEGALAWLVMDAGAVVRVCGFVAQSRRIHGGQHVTRARACVSEDGAAWADVDGGAVFETRCTPHSDFKHWVRFAAPVAARFLRLHVIAHANGHVAMRCGILRLG